MKKAWSSKYGWYVILLLAQLQSCRREELRRIPELRTIGASREGATITVTGEILDLGNGVFQHGHCWAEDKIPDISDSTTQLGVASRTGEFISSISIERGKEIFVRAYLATESGVLYGESMSISFPHWERMADPPWEGRFDAISFKIGNYGYIGMGRKRRVELGGESMLSDFWRFDPTNDTWERLMDFGPGPRAGTIGFAIGNKAYIGGGFGHRSSARQEDWWEYDSELDLWTQKTDPPFFEWYGEEPVAFSIGDKGFVGLLERINSGDAGFWEYNQFSDQWTQRSFPEARTSIGGIGVSALGKGYVLFGFDNQFSSSDGGLEDISKEVWEYDPATDQWTRKADFPGQNRMYPHLIPAGNKFYVGHGDLRDRDLWEYNPENDSWTQLEGVSTNQELFKGIAFELKGRVYIGAGIVGHSPYNENEFWKYTP